MNGIWLPEILTLNSFIQQKKQGKNKTHSVTFSPDNSLHGCVKLIRYQNVDAKNIYQTI